MNKTLAVAAAATGALSIYIYGGPVLDMPQAHAQMGNISCNLQVLYDTTTSGSTQLVAAPVNHGRILVCNYALWAGATSTSVQLQSGTGTACQTGTSTLTPAWQLGVNGGIVEANPNIILGDMKALCVSTSAGNAVQARINYMVLP